MAVDIKDLCRLCAKKDEFSKDLMEESNRNVHNLVKHYTKIIINERDYLPTKICLNCEEKIVGFEMFILECCKAQEVIKKMWEDTFPSLDVKIESPIEMFDTQIKSEVKYEIDVTSADLVSALNSDPYLSVIEAFPENDDHDYDDGEDDDYLDDIAISELKHLKNKRKKKKEITQKEMEDFNEILKKPNLKVKDFVKLNCDYCGQDLKTWGNLRIHYAKQHKSKAFVTCLCGFIVHSKSALYRHVSDHKVQSKNLRKKTDAEDKELDDRYATLNVKDFVRFNCSLCEKECSSWYSLKSHSEIHHKVVPVVTCVCGITLKSKSVMYKHIQDHKNPDVFTCDKCPRITKTQTAMNKHKMRHVPKGERQYCCGSCEKMFTTKDALKSHVRSHIPIEERKIYHCEICNVRFTTRSSAASHKRVVHDKIKCYVCDLCGYSCGTNGELRQHRAIHSDDKPFVCSKCSKPFKTYSNLKTHMDTHDDTSYECFICRRVLNSRRTLRKHLLVHEDKCRHVCSFCNKAFKRRQTLKVHLYTHTGDKPLSCKWCDERFSYASTLRSHRMRSHPEKMAARSLLTGIIQDCNTTL